MKRHARVHTGNRNGYSWVVGEGPRTYLFQVLRACPDIVRKKYVAITSFDSGPLSPSREEEQAGWHSEGSILYSPRIINPASIPHDQFDEWLVFSEAPPVLGTVEVFINYGGFTPADPQLRDEAWDETWDKTWDRRLQSEKRDLQERFWAQLQHLRPESYLAEGDNFVFVTLDHELCECVTESVQRTEAA